MALYEQPVGALAILAIGTKPRKHPAAVESFAFYEEVQLAAAKLLFRRPVAHRLPMAAIPELYRAAAILALGNGPFEVAVVERMVFDFDSQATVPRTE